MAITGDKRFVLSDESINSYGFRVLLKGGDLKQFKKNPIMLFNHRSWGESYTGPIGRWDDVKVENGELTALPVFDDDDEIGVKIAGKVENGFLKGASIGFRIVETSVDPSVMLPGQTRPTVTKWKLVEASVVDVPSNDSALALYDDKGNIVNLSDDTGLTSLNAVLPALNSLPQTKNDDMNMINLSLAQLTILKLSDKENVTEADVTKALSALNQKAADYYALKLKHDALESKLQADRENEITQLVADAVKANRIGKGEVDAWTNVLKNDFENGKTLLSAKTAPIKVTDLAKKTSITLGAGGDDEKDYDYYHKNGLLAQLKAENEELYNELLNKKKTAVKLRGLTK